MSEANKVIARRLWDVWNSRDLDKLRALIAEGHVNHDPNNPADLVGVDGYRELITLYTTMFSDLRFEIHDIVADGDCSAPGFLDSGLTVFASMLPRPARRSHVAPERGFDSGTSLASTARCTSA